MLTVNTCMLTASALDGEDRVWASNHNALSIRRGFVRATLLTITVPANQRVLVHGIAHIYGQGLAAACLRIDDVASHETTVHEREATINVHAMLPASSRPRTVTMSIEWVLSLHEIIELLARALDFWRERWQTVSVDEAPELIVRWPTASGNYSVQPRSFGAPVEVDAQALALILLGHGRKVDIGECPACIARSGKRNGRRVLAMYEWGQTIQAQSPWLGVGPGYWDQPHEIAYYCMTPRVWLSPRDALHWAIEFDVRGLCSQPCRACAVDGLPTGKHTIPWEQAVFDATPRPVLYLSDDGFGARMAALAATRTTLAVLADRMQAEGDDIGTLTAAWLAGPEVFAQHTDLVRRLAQALAAGRE